MHSSIYSVHISPSTLRVNSKSFFKSLFSLVLPSGSSGYKKWITGVSPIAGGLPAQFILPANSFSMRIQFPCSCLAVDLLYILCICIHLWPVYLFIADGPPPSLWWEILTKIDRAICETIEVQYTLRLSFALRNFNCCKINRGWCWILNLLLVYELLARRHLKHAGAHASAHTLRSVPCLWSCDNTLAAKSEHCSTVL